jgi:hypothetical protein
MICWATLFFGIRWSTLLSLALCSLDFAGIARLVTRRNGRATIKDRRFLFGAWLMAATFNAPSHGGSFHRHCRSWLAQRCGGQHIAARHHYAASSRDHSMGHPHSDHWIARRAAGEKTRLKADR